jgi:DNA ligase (NAD+)
MTTDAIKARLTELVGQIEAAAAAYYGSGEEIMSDAQYDALEVELRELEISYPELTDGDYVSPLDKVGAPAELYSPVRHATPMLSLQKAFTQPELDAWLAQFEPGTRFLAMPKFDGVSGSATFKNGKLTRFATRGDGVTGEDLTPNVGEMRNLPATLPGAPSGTIEVRGETVMMKADFDAYNASVDEGSRLKNTRNGAAGTLRAKSRDKVATRILTFQPFDLLANGNLPSQPLQSMLRAVGFAVSEWMRELDAEELPGYIAELAAARADMDVDIDGVVFRVADRAVFDKLGATGHSPRGAIAYKLAAEVAETVLLDVEFTPGKSGQVGITAILEPIYLAGTTIRRASLHNLALIVSRDIRIGDVVNIRRAGDVIPQVDGPADISRRDGSERAIAAPDACPSCGEPLIEVGESRILQCENIRCPAQVLRRLVHYASRAAADIEGFSSATAALANDAGFLTKPSDFYRLTKEQLLSLDRMGDKVATKLLASIETSKGIGMRRWMIASVIPLASEGTAKRLVWAGYDSVEQVAAATQAELETIDDIGPAVAASLVRFFSLAATKQEISDLRSLGVNLDALQVDKKVTVAAASADSGFAGKTVCISGTMAVTRSLCEAAVEQAGGTATGSIGKKCNFLIAGPGAGSKLAKAEALGVTVLDELAALAMLPAELRWA